MTRDQSFFWAADSYIRRMRNRQKKCYAIGYASRLMLDGIDADPPTEEEGLSFMARHAVEMKLRAIYNTVIGNR